MSNENSPSNPDEPPLLRLYNHEEGDSISAIALEEQPFGIRLQEEESDEVRRVFEELNGQHDLVEEMTRGTGERIALACEDIPYSPEQLENVSQASDTFETEIYPDKNLSREDFLRWAEENMKDAVEGQKYIMLSYDGATYSVSFTYDAEGYRVLYFDHHHKDDPAGTRSCCHQMLSAIREGRFVKASDTGMPHVIRERLIDCDQDVCLTRWLSRNWRKLLQDPMLMERMRELVEMEDELDIYAGFVPTDPKDEKHYELFRKQVWIFQPYTDWRNAKKPPERMNEVLEAVSRNIDLYAEGKAELGVVDETYTELDKGFGWIMIDEACGQQAKQKLMNQARVVMTSAEKSENRWGYTVSQVDEKFLPMSEMPVTADIDGLCDYLNALEGIAQDATDRWGGRKGIVIGSPREAKSKLTPEELKKAVQMFLYDNTPPGRGRNHILKFVADVVSTQSIDPDARLQRQRAA